MKLPRIAIAALRGGSGKTVVSIGIIAALTKIGKKIAPYKKGPDYIDAGWLSLAAGRSCINLDTFLIPEKQIIHSFVVHMENSDIAVIEGNRGLYDGIDYKGSTSTAELAKLIKCPVILCVDCTMATRTIAALILGCLKFDPDVDIKGVVINRVAGLRHETILRKSIEYHCGVPVMGAIPKLDWQNFPERHMGLVPTHEHEWALNSVEAAKKVVQESLDLDKLISIADNASQCLLFESYWHNNKKEKTCNINTKQIKIGIFKDSAFQFYYPENIEAIIKAGADIVYMSPLMDDTVLPVDAIYIGGGFPETHAKQLAQNVQFKNKLKNLANQGLPIYAECGGLIYLGDKLVLGDNVYPMTGILPAVFGFFKKPVGHGYTIFSVERENPYFPVGTKVCGHEFHYSKVLKWKGQDSNMAFAMEKGKGFINRKDGVCYKNVLGTYSHIHASGTPCWAKALVDNAILYNTNFRNKKNKY